MTTIEQLDGRLVGRLEPYRCQATNAKLGHRCNAVLLEAWSPGGAVVRRRCKQCGAWSVVVIRASDPPD